MKNIIAGIEVLIMTSVFLFGCSAQSRQSKEKSVKSDSA